MTHIVIYTRRAERELLAASQWWAENRSTEQAARWLDGIADKIDSLSTSPQRCLLIAERRTFDIVLRELYFGLGRRPTHRIIFTIGDGYVLVLTVRHLAQDRLRPEDIT